VGACKVGGGSGGGSSSSRGVGPFTSVDWRSYCYGALVKLRRLACHGGLASTSE